jgi:DtxR family Mn-dependent transcriptional regulator
MDKTLSSAVEDYLKTIYNLREESDNADARGESGITTQAVAARLGVAAPSATAMIKKLAALGLAQHTPYYGVELSPKGEKIALEVIRHHRLSETFLTQVLGVEWDKAHEEAEKWEHILSEEVEARMAALLGDPTHDPHGSPIPTLDGKMARDNGRPLSEVEAGTHVVVRRVSDEDGPLLRHLQTVGLVPGAEVEVLRAVPAEGVIQLQIGNTQHTVGLAPATAVMVEKNPRTTNESE